MENIISKAFWDIAYHEEELPKFHRRLGCVRGLLECAGIRLTDAEIENDKDAGEDVDEDFATPREFAAWLMVDVLSTIKYHDRSLMKAHTDLANAKALMRRAGMDLDLQLLDAEQRKRLDESR